LLEDGTWFGGTVRRPIDPALGEVVFTTNLSGTRRPSPTRAISDRFVVMTAPMIGNYGVNPSDMESPMPQVRGVVVRS
jgi:carbamoyl-phosphate synthase small subunit